MLHQSVPARASRIGRQDPDEPFTMQSLESIGRPLGAHSAAERKVPGTNCGAARPHRLPQELPDRPDGGDPDEDPSRGQSIGSMRILRRISTSAWCGHLPTSLF